MPEVEKSIKWSFQESLRAFIKDQVGLHILSSLDEKALRGLAQALHEKDLYRCATIAHNGLSLISKQAATEEQTLNTIEHVLWCFWRTSLWSTDDSRIELPLSSKNQHHANETGGVPTIVVAPMMLCTNDVLSLVIKCFSNRPIVLYGEGIETNTTVKMQLPENVQLIGDGSARSMGSLIRTLLKGGVFCTYPDFVYEGHPAISGRLFGRHRLFSKAFISLCTRPNIHLLPAVTKRDEEGLTVHFEEAVVIEADGGPSLKELTEATALYTIQALLEDLICKNQEQWLLLGTMSAAPSRTYG
jgi:hypothetical protein